MIYTISLELIPSFYNNWPEIEIAINNKIVWHNFVTKKTRVDLEFEPVDINHLKISYLNKRAGPDVWDTEVDDTGKIVADQNCVITKLYINRSKCDWLLQRMIWHYGDQEALTYGHMNYRGYTDFAFPIDVYSWIANERTRDYQPNKKSSIDYKTLKIGDQEIVAINNAIDEITQLLKKLHA